MSGHPTGGIAAIPAWLDTVESPASLPSGARSARPWRSHGSSRRGCRRARRPSGSRDAIRGSSGSAELSDSAVGVLEQLRDGRVALFVRVEPVGTEPLRMLADLGTVEM